jgi:hypothetical protein
MNAHAQSNLRDFHHFVGERVNNGGASLTPEEVLDEWRLLHPENETADEDGAAIQEAIDDMKNGDKGIPFAEFDRDFRSRHQLPPQA